MTVEVVTRYGGFRHLATAGTNPEAVERHFTLCRSTSAWTLASWRANPDHPQGLTVDAMAELAMCPACLQARAKELAVVTTAGVDELRAAVLAIHFAVTAEGYDPYCHGCWTAGGMDGAPSWPCPTAVAVDPSLAPEPAPRVSSGVRCSTAPCAGDEGHDGPHTVGLSFPEAWKAAPPSLEPDDRG